VQHSVYDGVRKLRDKALAGCGARDLEGKKVGVNGAMGVWVHPQSAFTSEQYRIQGVRASRCSGGVCCLA
jgi:hypothetical protein